MSWDLLEEAKRIISINSVTYESNRPIVDYVCGLLKNLDLQIELDRGELYHKEQFNLIAKKGPDCGDGLLFNTHLDTVSPGDFSLWDKTGGNPFRATVIDNKIFGLGTADVKLDILCKIKALERFKGREFKNPFMLIGTFGEESGLEGAKKLVETHKVKPRYAVVGEPSNLSIVYAHKGHLVFDIILKDEEAKEFASSQTLTRVDFFGKSAHSSTPHLGINAIQKGFDFLKEHRGNYDLVSFQGGSLVNVIPDRAFLHIQTSQKLLSEGNTTHLSIERTREKRMVFSQVFVNCFEELRDIFKKVNGEFKRQPMPEFDPPMSTLNIGVISTEGNSMKIRVGVRTLPSLNSQEFIGRMKEQLDQLLNKFPNVQGSLQGVRESLSMKTELGSTLVTEAKNVLRNLGLQDTVVTKASSTEASVYNQIGVESIVWGPGVSIDNVHKPNEFNYLHHLDHAINFYEKIIEVFCIKGVK